VQFIGLIGVLVACVVVAWTIQEAARERHPLGTRKPSAYAMALVAALVAAAAMVGIAVGGHAQNGAGHGPSAMVWAVPLAFVSVALFYVSYVVAREP